MCWRMVFVSSSTMQRWLLQANICLSMLILVSGSQQDKFSWAPAITLGMLFSWSLTGTPLVFLYNRHLIQNRPWIFLYPLGIWLIFIFVLQTTSLAEAILILPLCTTAAMLLVATRHHHPGFERSTLPPPATEPNRR